MHEAVADPVVNKCRRVVSDLREASLRFGGQEISQVVRVTLEPRFAGERWVTALVVGSPVQLGIASQYLTYAQDFVSTSIFNDEDAALAWMRTVPCSNCNGPHVDSNMP